MADYKKKPGSKIAFELTVSEDAFKKAQKGTVENFKKNVEIKGFRKGHAPENAVVSAMGMERLMMDSLNTVVDREYRKFLQEHNILPISQPTLDVGDMGKMPVKVSVEVEIFPEVTLGDYQKIKTEKVSVAVKADEVTDVIETIMADMNLGVPVTRGAKKKDQVVVSFAGKDKEGNVLPRTEGKETPFRLGFGHFLEDLEKGIEGMKPGEEKTKIPVKFPKDYHAPDMAGKTVYFDVTVHEVKEINGSKVDEDTVEKVTGKKKSVEEFRKEIENLIIGNKTNAERQKLTDKYKEDLAKYVKVDLPESWIAREVEMRMKGVKESPQYAASPEKFWKAIKKDEKALEKEFQADAEKGLKIFLGLSELVKKENIELNKDEMEIVHQRVHQKIPGNDHSSHDHAMAMERESLNFKIDKFLTTLFS